MQPSVLAPALSIETIPSPMDGFESYSTEASSSSRRQRITMACQYCRHRKIRCCGGEPCRNCTRSNRTCEYTPVPEEVNRATRQKKAVAKAAKVQQNAFSTPTPLYGPFTSVPSQNFDGSSSFLPVTPTRPGPSMGIRRSISTPSLETPLTWTAMTPMHQSPAVFETPLWKYNNAAASGSQPPRAFPSVLEQTPLHTAYLNGQYELPQTPPHSRSPSAEVQSPVSAISLGPQMVAPAPPPMIQVAPMTTPVAPMLTTSYSTPNLTSYLQPPAQIITPASPPATPTSGYYSPYATPNIYSVPQMPVFTPSPIYQTTISPTLAPELSATYVKDAMYPPVGLGIGMELQTYHTPLMANEEYFSAPPMY